jgi:hypothetical protein
MSSPETFPGETFERLLASAIAADWRTSAKPPQIAIFETVSKTVIRR